MASTRSQMWLLMGCLAIGPSVAHAGDAGARATSKTEPPRASEPNRPGDSAPTAAAEPAPIPTVNEVLVAYQRVGHALLLLQDQRGKFDCGDLMPRFRSIKLSDAVASPQARATTALELSAIAAKIQRLRGVHVEQACKDNPLAASCR